MYWINAGEIPTIERANMDGTNQVSVIATGLKDPVGKDGFINPLHTR